MRCIHNMLFLNEMRRDTAHIYKILPLVVLELKTVGRWPAIIFIYPYIAFRYHKLQVALNKGSNSHLNFKERMFMASLRENSNAEISFECRLRYSEIRYG